jgi:hypothetical protein
MFRVTNNSREYLRELAKVEKGLQRAAAGALNAVSGAAASRQAANVRRTMIVRGQYTEKSLVHYKAGESKPLAKQNAIVGTKSPYLPVHDKGGRIKARKRVIAVPTNRVRGKDRRKKVPSRYRIDKMAGAFVLRPNGGRLKRPALFIRQGKKGKLVKVRDLGASNYTLKARLWHTEAVKKYGTYPMMAAAYRREAKRILGKAAT